MNIYMQMRHLQLATSTLMKLGHLTETFIIDAWQLKFICINYTYLHDSCGYSYSLDCSSNTVARRERVNERKSTKKIKWNSKFCGCDYSLYYGLLVILGIISSRITISIKLHNIILWCMYNIYMYINALKHFGHVKSDLIKIIKKNWIGTATYTMYTFCSKVNLISKKLK